MCGRLVLHTQGQGILGPNPEVPVPVCCPLLTQRCSLWGLILASKPKPHKTQGTEADENVTEGGLRELQQLS